MQGLNRPMLNLLLFCLLLLLCWPLALLALILYPLIWLILLPFRLVGIAVGGAFHLIEAIFMIPIRILTPRRDRVVYQRRIGY